MARSSRCVHAILVLALVIVLIGSDFLPSDVAYGQTRGPGAGEVSPGDYLLLEIAAGTLGGAFAGKSLLELWIRVNLCNWALGTPSFDSCRRNALFISRPLFYPLLVFGGASLGVWASGMLNHVEGNLFAMLTGTLTGSLAGTVIAYALFRGIFDYFLDPDTVSAIIEAEETPEYIKRLLPLTVEFLRNYELQIRETVLVFGPAIWAAVWGAIGYNVGAVIADSSE